MKAESSRCGVHVIAWGTLQLVNVLLVNLLVTCLMLAPISVVFHKKTAKTGFNASWLKIFFACGGQRGFPSGV